MTLTLDPQTEQTIQREIDLGHAHDAAEVIARAVALLECEEAWFTRNKEALIERLDASYEQGLRGDTIDGEVAMEKMEQMLRARHQSNAM